MLIYRAGRNETTGTEGSDQHRYINKTEEMGHFTDDVTPTVFPSVSTKDKGCTINLYHIDTEILTTAIT